MSIRKKDIFNNSFYIPVLKVFHESSELDRDAQKQHKIDVQRENVKRVLSIGPPSTSAQHSTFFGKVQRPQPTILNHRPHECLGPPVVLYSDAFNKFIADFKNEDLVISPKVLEIVNPLMNDMADGYKTEKDRCMMLEKYLSKIIWPIDDTKNDDGTISDGVILLPLERFRESAMLFLFEIKNEIGTGHCDPTVQGALSYVRRWAQDKFECFRRCCNCPSIILAVAGPWICVLGAIYLESGVIDPLTDMIPLVQFHHQSNFKKVARLLESLHLAFGRLKEFYKNLSPYDSDNQRFYPFLHEYTKENNVITFIYNDSLANDKLIWKATTSDKRQIVVKLTQQYNEKAHELCASKRLAPKLLYAGNKVINGWWIIVMEYIQGVTLYNAKMNDEEYLNVLQDVNRAIELLHESELVFGDLRPTNIMVYKNHEKTRAMLVDFDWCGKHKNGRYPSSINPVIKWPKGVKDWALLDKTHDIYWLNMLTEKKNWKYENMET